METPSWSLPGTAASASATESPPAARRPARDLHPDGNRKAYVRNGAQGTVAALHEGALFVDFDGIGTIRVPRPLIDGPAPGLDHAYALTHAARRRAWITARPTPSPPALPYMPKGESTPLCAAVWRTEARIQGEGTIGPRWGWRWPEAKATRTSMASSRSG